MNSFNFNLKELSISNGSSVLRIEGINFSVEQSEKAISILGESGMGKTTIFKSLFPRYIALWSIERGFKFSCLHSYNGQTFDDTDIVRGKVPAKIGYATQTPYFFCSETVKENLFAPLKWKGIFWTEDRKEKYIQNLQLDCLVNKEMSILSGGEAQLINVSRMLVLEPDIAIIDECFSSMDEQMSQKYIELMKQLFPNCIFLLTSHRRSDVERFGGKIIRLMKESYKSGSYYVSQKAE